MEEGKTVNQILSQYGINNRTQLLQWCSKYRDFGEHGLIPAKRGRPRKEEVRMPKSTEEPLWFW